MIEIDRKESFYGDATSGTATKNSTTNIDYCMPSTKALFGAALIYKDAVDGDWVEIKIVDVDNVLGYGAGTVVGTFVNKWYIDSNRTDWGHQCDFAKTIPEGVYVRLAYHSTGTVNDVPVKLNLYMLH